MPPKRTPVTSVAAKPVAAPPAPKKPFVPETKKGRRGTRAFRAAQALKKKQAESTSSVVSAGAGDEPGEAAASGPVEVEILPPVPRDCIHYDTRRPGVVAPPPGTMWLFRKWNGEISWDRQIPKGNIPKCTGHVIMACDQCNFWSQHQGFSFYREALFCENPGCGKKLFVHAMCIYKTPTD